MNLLEGVFEFTVKNDWFDLLGDEFGKDYFDALNERVTEDYESCAPHLGDVFRALTLTPFSEVKVVILGQDPYHTPGAANGLSFAVHEGNKTPPSLKNIFTELTAEYGAQPDSTTLLHWAQNGVLMLNSVLTCKQGTAKSHAGLGWEQFTTRIIKLLSAKGEIVFILWGKDAQQKAYYIDETANYIIESPHPSPLSAHRGFVGSKPFSRANKFLDFVGKEKIKWM